MADLAPCRTEPALKLKVNPSGLRSSATTLSHHLPKFLKSISLIELHPRNSKLFTFINRRHVIGVSLHEVWSVR